MLRPDYPLRTERLTLRPYTMDDFEILYDIHRRPDVARYLMWEPRTAAEVRDVLARKITRDRIDEEGQGLALAVDERATGRLIGEVNLVWLSRPHRQGEIGFVFHPDSQGRGYATEAAQVALRLGFADLGLHRIIGRCDPRNVGSAGVMEKLGMRREAHLVHCEIFKGEWGDVDIYALLDDEWKAR